MAQKPLTIWLALLPTLLKIAAVSAIFHPLGGPSLALAVLACGLLWVVVSQTRQLVALAGWIESPDAANFPDADDVWGEVFLQLSRRLRNDTQAVSRMKTDLDALRQAVEVLPIGIVFLTSSHQIRWCNKMAAAHLGIRIDEDFGTVVGQLVRAPGFANYLADPARASTFLLQTEAARPRFYELQIVALGERSSVLVSRDVTDVQRTDTVRRDFVANVSHELRTPLTVIGGFLEHLGDDQPMSEEQRHHFIELMRAQSARMLSLVDDLLILSRLETDDKPANEEWLDMQALMQQLLVEAQGLSKGRHVIRMRCDGPYLRGSPKELHGAFSNLVSNAVRYTPEGGEIEITWQRRQEGDANLGIFAVRDSGPGLAPEHLPRLTERFYRVDRGRSSESGGTGLGLAIVKHVLLRHQGKLDIASTLGAGSTFSAAFPSWRLSA